MNYLALNTKNPSNTRRHAANSYAALKAKILVKNERITNLKKALFIGNKERDRMMIESIDEQDVEELQDLLAESVSSDEDEEQAPLNRTTQNPETDDDIIEVGGHLGKPVRPAGVAPMEIDEEFSLQYAFFRNVSKQNFHTIFCTLQ